MALVLGLWLLREYPTTVVVLAAVGYLGYKFVQKQLMARKLARWSNTPKDVVILHGLPRGKTIPSPSAFVLKLETFLRMAKIKYEYDPKDSFGPHGKSPWVTLNGEHFTDSQLIVDHLTKKFELNLNGGYSDEELALSTLARVAIEEHAFWGLAIWAFVLDSTRNVYKVINIKPKWLIPLFIGRNVKKLAWAQGLGRHTPEDIEKLMTKDIQSISTLLGTKKFFLGDEPCADDAGIFGFLAQTQWGLLMGSPYEKLVNGDLKNIKEYCRRMRERYWPDWDSKCEP